MPTQSVPTDAISIYNRALEFSNKGDFITAIEEYRRALDVYPKFIEAYNNMGELLSQLGDSDMAIKTYMDALKISKNFKVLLNLGVEFFNKNDYDSALKYFKDSIAVNRDFIEGHFYAGMVHYNRKNMKDAEKKFSRVVAIDKKHYKANYLLAYIYYEMKDYKRTLECLDLIKDIAEDKSFISRYYGFCYYYMGRYDEAVKFLKVAVESRPEYAKFRDYLTSLTYENRLREIGDLDKAIAELEGVMTSETPDFKDATRLSMMYIFRGENKKAEELLISVKEKLAS